MSYKLIRQFSNQHAHLSFTGQFQGVPVTWDTHFFTLNYYLNYIAPDQHEQHDESVQKQFIDIEQLNSNIMKLTVALKIDEITQPSIHKMMIMINLYKNLTHGRHEYG